MTPEDEHRAQVRARSRAFRRLADLYPELFAALLQEEERIEGIDPGRKHVNRIRGPSLADMRNQQVSSTG